MRTFITLLMLEVVVWDLKDQATGSPAAATRDHTGISPKRPLDTIPRLDRPMTPGKQRLTTPTPSRPATGDSAERARAPFSTWPWHRRPGADASCAHLVNQAVLEPLNAQALRKTSPSQKETSHCLSKLGPGAKRHQHGITHLETRLSLAMVSVKLLHGRVDPQLLVWQNPDRLVNFLQAWRQRNAGYACPKYTSLKADDGPTLEQQKWPGAYLKLEHARLERTAQIR